MTEVWATSSVFTREVKFNWKINDFSLLWIASGSEKVDSPRFKIGDDKGCYLRIKEIDYLEYMDNEDVMQKLSDGYRILLIAVILGKKKIPMGGFLSIDMKDDKITGDIFGSVGAKMARENNFFLFKILSSSLSNLQTSNRLFCISPHTTRVDIGVKLYFPSPISSTVRHVPQKDRGLVKLSADMRALLNRSSESSDFSIECGGKTFPCHEAILRARSTVLDAMFQNDMTESSARSLVLMDVSHNTVASLLEFMYTGGITGEVGNMKELMYVADKYDMEGLLDICFRRLPEMADDMIVDFLFMADKHSFVEYKKQAMVRINMNKSKFLEDQEFMEKLKALPELLLELYKF